MGSHLHHHHHGHGGGDGLGMLVRWISEMLDGLVRALFRSTPHASDVAKGAPTDRAAAAERIERVKELTAKGDADAIAELQELATDSNRAVRSFASTALANLRGGLR